jgi:hypothetical protein
MIHILYSSHTNSQQYEYLFQIVPPSYPSCWTVLRSNLTRNNLILHPFYTSRLYIVLLLSLDNCVTHLCVVGILSKEKLPTFLHEIWKYSFLWDEVRTIRYTYIGSHNCCRRFSDGVAGGKITARLVSLSTCTALRFEPIPATQANLMYIVTYTISRHFV